jgi:hypothetical protein
MKYKVIDSLTFTDKIIFPKFLIGFSYTNGRYWIIENQTNIFVNFFDSQNQAEYYCEILNRVDDE